MTNPIQDRRPHVAIGGRLLPVAAMLLLVTLGTACEDNSPQRIARMKQGYIYYLDGAGGGGMVTNWGRGVRIGFINAGYPGAGEIYTWQTGLGVVVDQNSSVSYKRGKAAKLARDITEREREYPGVPITVMGLSAGTAVAVYTLEELPRGVNVDNVVLLGASISSTYDLTKALEHVNNEFFVFTSDKDDVLLYAVPIAGTADRQQGSVPAAGLRGFRPPSRPSAETRAQYRKVRHINWQPQFTSMGWKGGHTDSVSPRFVEEYVAPLVMKAEHYNGGPPTTLAGGVPNPDYEKWAKYDVGTMLVFEGEQLLNGDRHPIRIEAELVSKHSDKLVVERRYLTGQDFTELQRTQTYFVEPTVKPELHPLTHPRAKLESAGSKTIVINGQNVKCDVRSLSVNASFDDWGTNLRAKLYNSDAVPRGLAAVDLKSTVNGKPYEVKVKLVGYRSGKGAAAAAAGNTFRKQAIAG